ncbi:hypothetical protein L593_07765 [Salinarchaeum sp. Harcht-Bsk1]|uniref:hypothetical protein n=1 Tax=Salinarchaeum sp. Harcht-Bsk1 TaxID=1333523 RepID=UPI0003423B42|nr:hypothetical protein [Salinarchaeum sp. Harcht-Bsk1]AGN01498.1 hypothetical protein L593_07765 [Salinarchaeum sp. Harcht-Bsk1]
MGEHARQVQERLADRLAAALPAAEWSVERPVGGTPVDVAGETPDRLVLLELEWRRADPANNTAKLFRHLADDGALRAVLGDRDAVVVQLFTNYYDLASGGVSSKRRDATFVGAAAAEYLDNVAYWPVDLSIDPPKGGGELPEDWNAAVDAAVDSIVDRLEASR